jgi:hypothetical protein
MPPRIKRGGISKNPDFILLETDKLKNKNAWIRHRAGF